MRPPRRALAGAYAALAVLDTALAAGPSRWRRARVLTKPLLMPTLAARGGGDPLLLAAQAASWSGDVALMRPGRRGFLTGLCAFLTAHLAYVAALRSRSTVPLLATRGRRRFLAVGGVLAGGMALAAAREDRVLALPVAAYGATLATMAAAAAAVDPGRDRDLVLAGASLFLLSDTLLGIRTFVLDGDAPALEGAVMATYTSAQWCLAGGLTR